MDFSDEENALRNLIDDVDDMHIFNNNNPFLCDLQNQWNVQNNQLANQLNNCHNVDLPPVPPRRRQQLNCLQNQDENSSLMTPYQEHYNDLNVFQPTNSNNQGQWIVQNYRAPPIPASQQNELPNNCQNSIPPPVPPRRRQQSNSQILGAPSMPPNRQQQENFQHRRSQAEHQVMQNIHQNLSPSSLSAHGIRNPFSQNFIEPSESSQQESFQPAKSCNKNQQFIQNFQSATSYNNHQQYTQRKRGKFTQKKRKM